MNTCPQIAITPADGRREKSWDVARSVHRVLSFTVWAERSVMRVRGARRGFHVSVLQVTHNTHVRLCMRCRCTHWMYGLSHTNVYAC